MSIAPARAAQPENDVPVHADTRLDALGRALPVLAQRADPELVESVRQVAERVGHRLDLSAEHTVVALAGSTGSGKSSLFNALVGLDLSAVGLRRPTTGLPHACVWDPEGASELLGWLGIPPRLQTARESVLDADTQAELRGLVLLDLPDHDSIEIGHRVDVDRIVEMADMLVWVLDPQKYADAAVHMRYLEALARHVSVVVVVLNQVDRLTPEQRELCLDDLRRLLNEDGLYGVRVLATSAVRGDGLPELRALLAEAVAGHEMAIRRLSADLDGVAEDLHDVTGPEVREDIDRTSVKRLSATLALAAGVPAIGETVERTYRQRARRATGYPVVRALSWLGRAIKRIGRRPQRAVADLVYAGGTPMSAAATPSPQRRPAVLPAQAETALRDLADTASHGLPEPWPTQIRAATLATLETLTASLQSAVADVDLRLAHRRTWWRVSAALQWTTLGIAVAAAGWFVLSRTSGVVDPELGPVPASWLVGTVAMVLSIVTWAISWALAAELGSRTRAKAEDAMHDAVTSVSREQVLAPLRAQLRSYAEVHEALRILGQG